MQKVAVTVAHGYATFRASAIMCEEGADFGRPPGSGADLRGGRYTRHGSQNTI